MKNIKVSMRACMYIHIYAAVVKIMIVYYIIGHTLLFNCFICIVRICICMCA